jgi:ribosome maturation factor RimP
MTDASSACSWRTADAAAAGASLTEGPATSKFNHAARLPVPRVEMWGETPHFFVLEGAGRRLRERVNDELQRVVIEELDAVGFDLVELRRGGTKARPLVEVRIDRRDGGAVTVDDCARASRALEARLDASGLVGERYVLQVSSPGERAIRTPSEWRRFAGRWATVANLDGGRLEAKIVALEGADGGEVALLEAPDGRLHRVPLASVSEARLAFRI